MRRRIHGYTATTSFSVSGLPYIDILCVRVRGEYTFCLRIRMQAYTPCVYTYVYAM